jgi:hypothetical protein
LAAALDRARRARTDVPARQKSLEVAIIVAGRIGIAGRAGVCEWRGRQSDGTCDCAGNFATQKVHTHRRVLSKPTPTVAGFPRGTHTSALPPSLPAPRPPRPSPAAVSLTSSSAPCINVSAMALHLTIQRCSNLRSVQKFINQDPYVVAYIDDGQEPVKKVKTRTMIRGGRDPTWHSSNELALNTDRPSVRSPRRPHRRAQCGLTSRRGSQATVHLQVWDKELFNKDRLIAQGSFSLDQYEEDGVEDLARVLSLEYDKVEAGELHFVMSYEPVLDRCARLRVAPSTNVKLAAARSRRRCPWSQRLQRRFWKARAAR